MDNPADSALDPDAASVPTLEYEPNSPQVSSLRQRTLLGSVWTVTEYSTGVILRLGSNLILTRLLMPDLFGLMRLVNIFAQGLQMFSDVGIGPAIIQNKRGDDPTFLNTAWTIQVLRGVTLSICACLIAKPIALIYGQPQLTWLIPVAGLGALISGFNSTALFRLNRHLRLGRLTALAIATQVLSIAGMILWALLDKSVWALLVPGLIGKVFQLFVSHMLDPDRRDRFQWDAEARQAMFRFGKWIFLSTLLTFSANQADGIIFGKLISLNMLGVYGVALMLATIPTQGILKIGSAVVFPAYSRVQDDGPAFKRIFAQVRRSLLIVGALAVSGLIATGGPLVHILYDQRWNDAAWILPILASAGWLQVMECTNGSALLARGHAHWIAAGTACELAGLCAMIPLGFYFGPRFGVTPFCGAVVGVASADLLRYAVSVIGVQRLGLHVFVKDLALTLAVAATAAAAMLVGRYVSARSGSNVAQFFASASVVSCVWAPIAWIYFRRKEPLGVRSPTKLAESSIPT
jgi:O-antigen/teichoic acid export membrane protein